MPDYLNSKIFKLESPFHPEVEPFFGSTTTTLSKRMSAIKNAYKKYRYANGPYNRSFELMGIGAQIILIEEYPCNSKKELLIRENFYIHENDCVNKNIMYEQEDDVNQKKKEWLQIYCNFYECEYSP